MKTISFLLLVSLLAQAQPQRGFRPPEAYFAGTSPRAIVSADVNRDGYPDLVVAMPGSLAVLLNRGDGTFGKPAEFRSVPNPVVLASSDVNGDGLADLVVADASGRVMVLLGKGDGTFAAAADLPTTTNPSAMALADWNHDGIADLAIADRDGNRVLVFPGKGDGSFGTPVAVPVGLAPSAMAVADLNGDGHLDLAVANSGSNDVTILLGGGDLSFRNAGSVAAGAGASAIAAADFDADGHTDLAVLAQADGSVTLLLGKGDGAFRRLAPISGYGRMGGLATADLDGDGHIDLVLTDLGRNTVRVLLGKGDGQFTEGPHARMGPAPHGLVVGDFDRDGRLDVATADASGAAYVVLGSGGDLRPLTNPVFSLGTATVVVGPAAGNSSVILVAPTSTSAWTAASNASWLHVTTGSASGTGNTLVQFSIDANAGALARTGTLTIAGLTLTVTQAGAGYLAAPDSTTTVVGSTGLNQPSGVTMDASGNVYFCDSGNNAIKMWNPVTQQVTNPVTGLNNPNGIAVDAQGNLYIADTGSNTVKLWTASTQTLSTRIFSGLSSPYGLALDASGNLYIADAGHNQIQKWTASTQVLSVFATGFSFPEGVAVDAAGNVYIADTVNSVIDKWSVSTQTVSTIISGLPVGNYPTGVAVDGLGNVYFISGGAFRWSPVTQQFTGIFGLGVGFGVAVDPLGSSIYGTDNYFYSVRLLEVAWAGPVSMTEPAAATSDSVNVLPGTVFFTAASDQTWLTINSITGGVISFSVQANTIGSSRTAHITVFGQQITVTQAADVPAAVSKTAGDSQSATVTATFSTALQVSVTDAGSNPLPGATVTFTAVAGGTGASGTFSGNSSATATTGANGVATAPAFTANGTPGIFTVTAASGSASATFNLSATSPSLAKTAGDNQSAGSGTAFATALQVTATDSHAVAVAGASVTFTVVAGTGGAGAAFNGSSSATAASGANGVATAPALTANATAGAFTVTATCGTTTVTFNLTNSGVVYRLGSSTVTMAAAAGSGSVIVSSSSSTSTWTASSNAAWLHMTTTSGTGSQLALYTTDANAGSASRTGTLALAGQTFTVTQVGAGFISGSMTPAILVSSGLSQPTGMAVDSAGNVYFADSNNSAIKKWTAATQSVSTLISSGLTNPYGVAVDSQGNLYIANTGGSTILKWTASTQQLSSVPNLSAVIPYAVAVDTAGNLYVTNTDASPATILKWTASTQQTSTLVSSGLNFPEGIAVDGVGNLYIADTNNNALKEWSVATQQVSTLVASTGSPNYVAVDGLGNVYFSGNGSYNKWNAATQQVTNLYSDGAAWGVGIDAAGSTLYVSDYISNTIGRIEFSWAGPSSITEPVGGATDSVTVLPGSVPFTAASDQSWLTINSSAGGTIGFTVSANTGAARTAHINVLGQTGANAIIVSQTGPPSLSISKSHTGNFTQGQTGTYTLTVSNVSGSIATSGTVTVTDNAPSGLTVTALSGTGWTCTTLPTCTRSDALSGGSSYPTISVAVSVASNASSPQVNSVSVSGGGSVTANNADSTTIVTAVNSVSSTAANGTYGTGAVIPVTVTFGSNVTVTGTPKLTLNTSPSVNVNYSSGSGTAMLTFNYTVASGQSSAKLDEASITGLSGGTIKTGALAANLTLPAPGTTGSLGANKNIVVNTTPPTVSSVSSTTPNGTYASGAVVAVTVTFSKAVNVTGTPTLALNSGGTASYASGSGGTTLTFNYTVGATDVSAHLDYSATTSLSLNAGSIKDTTGNTATLTLAAPGSAGSLSANTSLVIDTVPAVTNVTTTLANGSYTTGTSVPITVTFSKTVTVTGTPKLALNSGGTASYGSGSGTATLTFNYTVGSTNNSTKLDYSATTSLTLNGGTIKDSIANAATLTLPTPGSAGSLSANKNIVIDTTAPTVTNVTSATANGSYTTGAAVAVTVTFSEIVNVTGTPNLALNSGGTASYASGSGTNTLTFNYTVGSADNSTHLDYTATTALTLNGGTIKDAATNAAVLTLPVPAAAGSLGANRSIVIDTTAPTVSSVSSTTANGTYGIGANIAVTVTFSEIVNVTGTPKLALNSGGTASYASGSGTTALTFSYTVGVGDTSAHLDYSATTSLTLNGGTIKDPATNAAVLTLAAPGAAGSLGANRNLAIDGVAPTVVSVTSTAANGSYATGTAIGVTVTLSKAVNVTGTPALTLNSGGTASYASGTGTNTLTFSYTVGATDNSAHLDYGATTSLTLNGGTIKDAASNAAALTLPAPGSAGSLGANKTIVIDTTPPTVSGVTSTTANNTYTVGANINVTVTFSELVTVTGTPQIALNSGGTAIYSSGSGNNVLSFTYTVASGQSSAHLDYAGTSALSGGIIKDAAGNAANLSLAAPGAAGSLSANSNIVITAAADLTIAKSHIGSFAQGQTGAVYTLTATNIGQGPTSGTVTVIDLLPTGLTASAMAGSGWSCNAVTVVCTRFDALAASASYPSITVTVTVASNAAASLTNQAMVSGGGETNTANDSASDITVIRQSTATAVQSSLNPSIYGISVTFTATVTGPGTPGGSVQFYDGSGTLGSPQTLSGGSATLTVSSLTVATHSITAAYSGDSTHLTSTSSALSQVVNGVPTSIGLTSSLNPSMYGQGVTFTATVSGAGGTPTGTVTFLCDGSSIGTGTLAGGVATLALGTLPVGARSITATYGGDTQFAAGSSPALSQAVNLATATVSLTSNLNPASGGQNVTFTATVTCTTGVVPTSTVTFKDGVTVIGQATLSGGAASFTTSALAPGTHSVTAVYSGDADFSGAISTALSEVIQLVVPSVALSSSANPSVTGQLVTFNVSVSGSAATPTGTVTILDGNTTLGTFSLAGGAGAATAMLTGTGASHSITATYSGDARYAGATSAALPQSVTAAGTTLALGVSSNPALAGTTVTFTASTSVNAPGQGTPTGTVTFLDGATTLGTAPLSGGTATYSSSSLAQGPHTITASFAGNAAFGPATSGAVNESINSTGTTTTLASSSNPAVLGQAVTLTATVTASGSTAPQGSVTFYNGGVAIGSAVTLASGVASLATSSLAAGTASLTAAYTSSNGLGASTSGALSQVVLVPVTVQASPATAQMTVDGTAYTGSQTFNWAAGSTHSLGAPSPQAVNGGTQLVWSSWSNGAAAATQTLTAPSVAAIYTAAFATQYLVTLNPSPALGGTVAGGGWYTAGATAALSATAATGYGFASFSGGVPTSSTNPLSVTVSGAITVAANFTAKAPALTVAIGTRSDGTAGGTRNVNMTLTDSGAGLAYNAQITSISSIIVLSGTGPVTLVSGVPGPNPGAQLAPGSSVTVPLVFNWPATATRIQITFRMTATDSTGTVSYPVTQTVASNR